MYHSPTLSLASLALSVSPPIYRPPATDLTSHYLSGMSCAATL
jgi:hypothetical protein